MDHNKHKQAFTLIEVLLYTAIVAVVLTIITLVFTQIIFARARAATVAEVDQQAMQILQLISQSVRDSEAIILPSAGLSSNQIQLDMVTAAVDPTTIALSGNTLSMTEKFFPPVNLSSNRVSVDNFLVTNLSRPGTKGVVRVALTLSYVNPDGRSENDYTQTYYASINVR